jgi:S-DNA-T family DNA segregation ATPase FtsK/SpoIIIE
MAKTNKKNSSETPSDGTTPKSKFWEVSKQNKLIIGSLLALFSIGLLIAFVSFFLHGQ